MVKEKDNSKIDYFFPGLSQEDDMRASAKITEQLQKWI